MPPRSSRSLRSSYRPGRSDLDGDAEQHAEEDLPLAPLDAAMHGQHPDLAGAQHRVDVTERGEVVQLEAQPRGVDVDELAGKADLHLLGGTQQGRRRRLQVVQRLLGGGVLHRVELEASEGGIHGEQQPAAGLAQEALVGPVGTAGALVGH